MGNNCKKPKVMIVGTFHMGGSKDLHSTEYSDLSSSKRQKEILEVVERLKEFSPTKIALELETKYDISGNKSYSDFVNGAREIAINESEQIGFRIAKDLNHEKVYAIDWMEVGVATKPYGEVYEWAESNQPELFNELFNDRIFKENIDSTILEMYKTCNNSAEVKKSSEHYINIARIGNMDEYVGIDWLIWWYQRNLILFSNICRLAETSEDRVLVIIGASHVYILEQFLRDSNKVELIDVNNYL